jgi:hypothetical protein
MGKAEIGLCKLERPRATVQLAVHLKSHAQVVFYFKVQRPGVSVSGAEKLHQSRPDRKMGADIAASPHFVRVASTLPGCPDWAQRHRRVCRS